MVQVSRRAVVGGISASALVGSNAMAQAPSFDQLLNSLINDPAAVDQIRQDREGKQVDFDQIVTRAILPRFPPSTRPISTDAIKMLVACEISSEARYKREFQKPVWPQKQSGVTIAIGYDLGYVTKDFFQQDWGNRLSPADYATLLPVVGKKGLAAKDALHLTQSINISWDVAYDQFIQVGVPLYVGETLAALPNAADLSEDALGALVSLVYNRGSSFKLTSDRFSEMRHIQYYVFKRWYSQVPGALEHMVRLWQCDPATSGLVARRKLEALLFRRGIAGLPDGPGAEQNLDTSPIPPGCKPTIRKKRH